MMTANRIKVLADELNLLISRMELGHREEESPEREAIETLPAPSIEDWLETAMDVYALRRSREKIFGSAQLFGEPTWDILLDLFIAELKNTKIQTTSACIGAQVPQTTALRWIALLERENLVRRYRDGADSRRVYIQLTDAALRKMVHLFYDRCVTMMARKATPAKTGPAPASDRREAVLGDLIAQLQTRRRREENRAG